MTPSAPLLPQRGFLLPTRSMHAPSPDPSLRQLRSQHWAHLSLPHQLEESNPSICSDQPVFRGTRIPVAVVVEQLRAGTPRQELEHDFPQLSQPAFDYAEIQARLPKPPGRPRKSLKLQRA